MNIDGLKHKDKLNIKAQSRQRKARFIGSLNLKKGQKVFELNTITGIISLAEYDESTINYIDKKIRKKLFAKENCIYVVAINLINAKKKFSATINKMNNVNVGREYDVDCPHCGTEKSVHVSLVLNNLAVPELDFKRCKKCDHECTVNDFV